MNLSITPTQTLIHSQFNENLSGNQLMFVPIIENIQSFTLPPSKQTKNID